MKKQQAYKHEIRIKPTSISYDRHTYLRIIGLEATKTLLQFHEIDLALVDYQRFLARTDNEQNPSSSCGSFLWVEVIF